MPGAGSAQVQGAKPAGAALDIAEDGPSHALPAIRGPRDYDAIVARVAQVMQEVADGKRTRMKREQQRQLMAGIVFAYWVAKSGRNPKRTKLDDDRERRIMQRLAESEDDLSEMLYAVDGSQKDPGLTHNERGRFDTIEVIFRDRAHIERLAEKMSGYQKGKPHAMVEKYRAILSDEAEGE